MAVAGSRTGGRISSQSSDLDSPGIHSTVHSWDSHANYNGDYETGDHRLGSSANAMPWPRAGHLIFYCDIQGHLKTATGLVRLLLLLSSAACLATLCSSGTAKVSLFMLPLVGRLRFMIFVAVFCLLITTLLLFLDISHIIYFFPFNWGRLNAWVFALVGLSYLTGSTLLILSILEYHGTAWVPSKTKVQLSATAGLGLSCALLSFLLSWLHGRHGICCGGIKSKDSQTEQLYKPVDNSSSSGGTLKERTGKQPPPWVTKGPRNKRQSSVDSNENRPPYGRRKDHWASAHVASSEIEELNQQEKKEEAAMAATERKKLQPQPTRGTRKREPPTGADSTNGNNEASNHNGNDQDTATPGPSTGVKRKTPPKKLALTETTPKARPRPSRDSGVSGTGKKAQNTRTSVTRSEIQEYWMQGYDHVQRTDKTTGNIEQWQSAAMKSMEEKKAKDAQWAQKWRRSQEEDVAKPGSSKTVEPFSFA